MTDLLKKLSLRRRTSLVFRFIVVILSVALMAFALR